MAEDLVLGSRALMNWIIKGGAGFVGLQVRLDAVYVETSPSKRPKAQLRYSYDATRQGLSVIETPLTRPLVTIVESNRVKQRFFRQDRHPSMPGAYAWANRHNMQWDIWGRTPVEVANLSDAVERIVVQMNADAVSAGRVHIELEQFEDVPYESESSIYRSLARGYCQAAQAVTT